MDDSQSLHLENKDSNGNRVTEMTKEDVQEPASEGDTLLNGQRSASPDLERPVVHQVASAPMPADSEFSFFDPNDPKCQDILFDPDTTISELFAVLRQWVPQVQQNISVIGNEILKRGCQANDRDGLTDMTLLHYTCKAGAPGIGDAGTAASFASQLISMGADPNLRSRWTNMNALHYAAYFDVPELICVVLKSSRTGEVDATCSDFDFGTALHISASNLCLSAVKCLLEHGANPVFRNDRGLIAADVVPDPLEMPLDMAETAALAKELRKVLLDALPLSCDISKTILPNYDYISGKTLLRSLGINLGDRVIIAGQKVGTLRFCGATEFASGQWAGVELDEPEGKNNGAVGGIRYFRCPPNHGIFAPLSKITRVTDRKETLMKCSTPKGSMPVRAQKIDLSRVISKVNSGVSKKQMNKKVPTSTELSDDNPGTRSTQAEGSVSIPFSSCSSSSTSSLDVKVPMNNKQKQTNPRLQNVSRTRRSMPASVRSTGVQRIFSMGSVQSEDSNIQVGDRVLVAGQRTGVVRFHGKTSFAPGFWYGVELDKPSGKNDGSVGTVRYFNCPPKHGVFAPPSRVQRVHGSLDSLTDISSRLSHSYPGMRRSYSTSSGISSQRELNKRTAVSRSRPAVLFRSWSTTSTSGSLSQTPDRGVKLHQGMQILLLSSNEMATLRYIGPTDFAPGLWLGLELRSPKGKNDGSVGDRRYFTCRPNYGVLVRPSRIAYRGINGAKLVDDCN
ncbi:CAP-Gly domain-containing linker protein 4-like isoform X2 [Erpetoichthys calabaricus]|uniref:CAP-Gly domain-containing linker protein 4-like isoform X2 n=1 Tax=Erpetoichthys calabaricus TaxID=27687 RepID=UPI00223471A2|nr:CAP-Gly domain-containing linker protein 4-like isoform X2 [Erpetoichthys calabaricus]